MHGLRDRWPKSKAVAKLGRRARRQLVAEMLLVGCGVLDYVVHDVIVFTHVNPEWDDTLTESEAKYLFRLRDRLQDEREMLRKFSQRLRTTD